MTTALLLGFLSVVVVGGVAGGVYLEVVANGGVVYLLVVEVEVIGVVLEVVVGVYTGLLLNLTLVGITFSLGPVFPPPKNPPPPPSKKLSSLKSGWLFLRWAGRNLKSGATGVSCGLSARVWVIATVLFSGAVLPPSASPFPSPFSRGWSTWRVNWREFWSSVEIGRLVLT